MDDEHQVAEDTLDTPEEATTDEAVVEAEEEQVDWEAKARKAEELANNYKIRAEKAEKKAKEQPAPVATGSLTPAEIIALSKANIEADDIDTVLDYAKYKNISVADALKSSVVKATLAEAAEVRKSSQAVATPGRRPNTAAQSDDKLLSNARNGIMPESEEDIARLFKLRMGKK